MKNAAPNIGAAFRFPGGVLVRCGRALTSKAAWGSIPPTVHLFNRGLPSAAHGAPMEIHSLPVSDKSVAPTANLKSLFDWAVAYARGGWHGFPLHSIRKGRCSCGQDCGKNAG